MEKIKPTFKFLGHANKINIEKFMERMEVKMEGVSDKLKVEYFEFWFSGIAQ
jgi:hypothetical protein